MIRGRSVLSLVFPALVFITCSLCARDVIFVPDSLTFYSPDSSFVLKIDVENINAPDVSPTTGTFSRRNEKGHLVRLWTQKLKTITAPKSVFFSQDGAYVVTVGNIYDYGYGDNIIVIYDRLGKIVRNYALVDFAPSLPPAQASQTQGWGGWTGAYWGRVDSIDQSRGELVLSVLPRAGQFGNAGDPHYVVKLELATGAVISELPVVGRPEFPDDSSAIQLIGMRSLTLPRSLNVSEVDMESLRDGSFVIAGPDYEGNTSGVRVIRIDSSNKICWEVRIPTVRPDGIRVIASRAGIILSFGTVEFDSSTQHDEPTLTIIAFSRSGEQLWQRKLSRVMEPVVAAADGGVLLACIETSVMWPNRRIVVIGFDDSGRDMRNRSLPKRFGGKTVMLEGYGPILVKREGKGLFWVDSGPGNHEVLEIVQAVGRHPAHTNYVYFGHVRSDSRTIEIGKYSPNLGDYRPISRQEAEYPTSLHGLHGVLGYEIIAFGSLNRLGRDTEFFAYMISEHGRLLWSFEYDTGENDRALSVCEVHPKHYLVAGLSGQDFVIFDIAEK